MTFAIVRKQVLFIALDLAEPFDLRFGRLSRLPRVLLRLTVHNGRDEVIGWGEASIDFPFSHYDAWDIYYALTTLDIEGEYPEGQIGLFHSVEKQLIVQFPAALAALDMALDDAIGKFANRNIMDGHAVHRTEGVALGSIGFRAGPSEVVAQARREKANGRIPKIKLGHSRAYDETVFTAMGKWSDDESWPYTVDFNGKYQVEEFVELFKDIDKENLNLGHILFVEQPTRTEDGIAGLVAVSQRLAERGSSIRVCADEVFTESSGALECARHGILLNFKIQKIGGLHKALEIEQRLLKLDDLPSNFYSTVGGTFPTALGRAYDQQCAAILRFAELPGDAWIPATEWFSGNQHLIREHFSNGSRLGSYRPLSGPGIGVTPIFDNIERVLVANPHDEYLKIRSGGSGERLGFLLKGPSSYLSEYESLSGKSWDWNL